MKKMNESKITRRSFVRGAAALAALLPVSGVLAACGVEPAAKEPVVDSAQAGSATAEAPAGEPTVSEDAAAQGATLVVYFSATGNTEDAAIAIAERLGADVFAIEAAEPYTEADLNYNDGSSRTSVERADGTNPDLVQVTPDGWDGYDTVLLGYPIWWGEAAWPLRTFVAGNDFAGKTVVPFCTSASSGIGRSGELLAEAAAAGDWLQGERFSSGAGGEAAEWAAGLGL